jgi:hypothetical protein
LADGTIVWTSPTGRVYRTAPGGLELFPQMRPACGAPKPRKRNRSREKALRIARARSKIRDQRPVNAETRRVNRARKQEIADRKWRNHMRKHADPVQRHRAEYQSLVHWGHLPLAGEGERPTRT